MFVSSCSRGVTSWILFPKSQVWGSWYWFQDLSILDLWFSCECGSVCRS